MNIYFDTEFTGLVPNTTLISIGMVTANNRKFYAEFTDFNNDLVDDWVRKNVIDNLLIDKTDNAGRLKLGIQWSYDNESPTLSRCRFGFCIRKDSYNRMCVVQGHSGYVAKELWTWLNQFGAIQLISDVSHYDMTLLCNLFGGAFNLPKNVNPCCYDINQVIAERFMKEEGMTEYHAMKHAFDLSREEYCLDLIGELPEGEKHNSLYDAEVIKMIYEQEAYLK